MCNASEDAVRLYVYPAGVFPSDVCIQAAAKAYCAETLRHYDAENYRIARTDKGKPYFADVPDLHVSLSHSDAYCIVALAPCRVGVDLQSHQKLPKENDADALQRYLRLSQRFFHPVENAYVQHQSQQRFFEVWTAKESYVKYTGAGLDDDFWTYSVIPPSTFDTSAWSAQDTFFQMIPFAPGYSLCVCTQRLLPWMFRGHPRV